MYRLTIIYTNHHVHVSNHPDKRSALEYLHNEGDHVMDYKLEKIDELESTGRK